LAQANSHPRRVEGNRGTQAHSTIIQTGVQRGFFVKDRSHPAAIRSFFGTLAVVLTTISLPILAQPIRVTPEEQTKRLKELLSLTDAQAAKVLKIYENSQEEMRKLFESGEEDRETMRQAMMTIMMNVDKQIDSLLAADQRKKFDQFRKERMSRMPRRRPDN